MRYRAAVDVNGIVIAFGLDENQIGAYDGTATWESFTFNELPAMGTGVQDYLNGRPFTVPVFKVITGAVASRTLEELQAAYGA